jgi:hypothetical protein
MSSKKGVSSARGSITARELSTFCDNAMPGT